MAKAGKSSIKIEHLSHRGARVIDRKGKRYGQLLAVEPTGERRNRKFMWRCICDCGNETICVGSDLASGRTKSCGCGSRAALGNSARTHGRCWAPEYQSWCAMITRCTNPNQKTWKNYGGRGIKICDSWLSFEQFFADMGTRPPNHTLDRIDNDGDYEPNNCRWSTWTEQARNRRRANHPTERSARRSAKSES